MKIQITEKEKREFLGSFVMCVALIFLLGMAFVGTGGNVLSCFIVASAICGTVWVTGAVIAIGLKILN